MARSDLFARFARTLRIADSCRVKGWSSREAVDRALAQDAARIGRRSLLAGGSIAMGAAALGCSGGEPTPAYGSTRSQLPRSNLDIGIVGAGLAGLSCANELTRAGVRASVYEASARAGGRCFSMGGAFNGPVTWPGQVIERGGELIDNLHKTMIAYAKEFGCTLEDYEKLAGDEFFYFNGVAVPEATVVDEYRALVDAMHDDLSKLSGGPTADYHNDFDVQLDNMTLRQYLDSRGAGALIKEIIDVVYTIEYGLDIDQQSALAFLMFIHADKRSRFQPFGVFSDERYHIIEGNQTIPQGLAKKLGSQISYGRELVRVAKRSDGRIELTMKEGTRTIVVAHDAVVITVPFSVLKGVDLDASLQIPAWKRLSIDGFVYGTNSKMMVGFDAPFWRDLGSNGASYSDQASLQCTWETNPTAANAQHAVLTNYTGGRLGASLDPAKTQTQVAEFLDALEKVYPGAKAKASRDGKNYRAHIEAWPRNPYSKGSYSCNGPGYFTTICDNEAKPVENLHFAGEHTSSFYEWQGFMEGACLSGIRAALEVIG